MRGHTGTRFQSTPSVWRETLSKLLGSATLAFQSTPSVWRETRSCCCSWRSCSYFNPLPPCGGRHAFIRLFVAGLHFNPLPPCGGRLEEVVDTAIIKLFQSTPSVWRETIDFTTFKGLYGISIHSLRVEGDSCRIGQRIIHGEFQSTPSVWRETMLPMILISIVINFNPLPPCGGRLNGNLDISGFTNFNPLPPCGGRPWGQLLSAPHYTISIHSLRVEGDASALFSTSKSSHFNPLPPCGGRPTADVTPGKEHVISIHSLRVEGDAGDLYRAELTDLFQSTPSVWRETMPSVLANDLLG